jgi:hypothetical protein
MYGSTLGRHPRRRLIRHSTGAWRAGRGGPCDQAKTRIGSPPACRSRILRLRRRHRLENGPRGHQPLGPNTINATTKINSSVGSSMRPNMV